MNVSFILIFLLFGAVATYFAGDKLAKTVALFFSLGSVVASIFILNKYNHGINTDFIANWISNPNLYIRLLEKEYQIQVITNFS